MSKADDIHIIDPATADSAHAMIAPVPRVSLQAFCETQDVFSVIQESMSDRRMQKAHVKVNMGGAQAAVESYRESPTPNVVVIESTTDKDSILNSLDELAQYCDAGTKVVVLGRLNDIGLYRDLMARGVSEYLIAPFGVVDFIRAVSELYNSAGATPVGRVVAFYGAKGGAGASTIAHNFAWTVSREFDMATVVVDMDLGFGTAGLDYNQDPPQGVADAIYAPDRLDANLVDRLLSKCTEKLSLLAAPATLDRMYDFDETMFDGLIDVLRASAPMVVLDIPHVWAAWTRRMLIGADEVVIVASPDLANFRNVKNVMDTLRLARPNDAKPRLVLNTVGMPKRPEIPVADFANQLEAPVLAQYPFDPKIFGAAANNGQMLGEVESGAKMAQIVEDMTRTIMGRPDAKRAKRTLFDPILEKLLRKKAS
jgi:pilus assembly protein CpaE